MTKKKKKESWKEKRRRAALKHQKALEAERLRREREMKKSKGWSRAKVLGIAFLVLMVIAVYAVWQSTHQASNEDDGQASLYTLTDADFSEFRGKVVVVDCFATWCRPCVKEIPHLAQINEKYNNSEVIVISVGSPGDSVKELRQFKKEHDITWRVARDTVGAFNKYKVEYIPTLVILNQRGDIHYRNVGLTSASTLSNEINALLAP